jgi:hypothetical protein
VKRCSIPGCSKEIHARQLCRAHYKRWWLTTDKGQLRKQIHRVHFSMKLWDRWMRETFEEHPHRGHLAHGISAFRERLNS